MQQLLEVLARFSAVTGIAIKEENGRIELSQFFEEAFDQEFISLENYKQINSVFESKK